MNLSQENDHRASDDEPSVRAQAVDTALAFLLVEAARGHSRDRRRRDKDTIMRLRDSLSYRSEALRWHAHMLRVLKSSAERRLDEVFPDREKEFHLLVLAGSEQHWMFDDLVFNALAAFDYLGNFVGFSYYGDRRRKAKWDRIQKYARDSDCESQQNGLTRISRSLVGPQIKEIDDNLVRGLSDYRAALIHYEALVGKGILNTKLGVETERGAAHTLCIRPPAQFYEYLRRDAPKEEELLQDAAEWLVRQCESGIRTILRQLQRDLRIEAGYDPDSRDGAIEMV